MTPSRLIVFDLDHTLLKKNCSFSFGLYLYQQNYFSFWKLVTSLSDYVWHKWGVLSLQDLHDNSFKRLFKGHPQEEIAVHVVNFLNSYLDSLLFEPLLLRLKAAQKEGDHVLILSSSPDFLVREIARRLSVTKWKSTGYETDNAGKFSKISQVMDGKNKAQLVYELAKELSIPLAAVTAYSDSLLDLPLLKIVGEPICVYPNKSLKKICSKNCWEIIN